MNFPSQILFNDINHGYRAAILKKSSLWLLPTYMALATYCYYEKVRRTMRTAIVSYFIKVGLPPSKKNVLFTSMKAPLKIMKNAFSFHLKSSFRSQDI